MKKYLFILSILLLFTIQCNAQCSALFTYSIGTNGIVTFFASGTSTNSLATSYNWTFGNSTIAIGANVTAQYNTVGTFTACLKVVDTTAGCTDSSCQSIIITGPPCTGTPTGGFLVANTTTPYIGQNVIIAVQGLSINTGYVFQWYRANSCNPITWTTLPGQTTSILSQTVVGTKAYKCAVTCTNTGLMDSSIGPICITSTNTVPTCSANYSYSVSSNSISLVADTTGNISSTVYSWYDSTNYIGQGVNLYYATNIGNHLICLIINNSVNNCVDTFCNTIVIPSPCSANYYIYPNPNGTPHDYIGVNTSTGTNLTYNWNWGDGNSSTGQYPSHTYASAGNYVITLVVDNGAGCIDSFSSPQTINKTATMYSVNFGTPTSVNSISKTVATIYPNPAKDNFTIKGLATAKYQVEIMNLNGSILKTISTNGNQAINISTLANNIYILKITNQDGTTQFAKLIKE